MIIVTQNEALSMIAYGYGEISQDMTRKGEIGVYHVQPVEIARCVLPSNSKSYENGICGRLKLSDTLVNSLYELAYSKVTIEKGDEINDTDLVVLGYWGDMYETYLSSITNENIREELRNFMNLFSSVDNLNKIVADIKLNDARIYATDDLILSIFYYLYGDKIGNELITDEIKNMNYSNMLSRIDTELYNYGFLDGFRTFLDRATSKFGGIGVIENQDKVLIEL